MGGPPDFVVIGAMKCATSTLHRQLAAQPGVWMTDPKEPNFFSDDDVFARGADWYEALFGGANPGDRRGEASTHYTKRDEHPHTVDRLAAHLGERAADIRFVYLMRHPVERLVSHYIHDWTQRLVGGDLDAAVHDHPPLIDTGRYAHQLRPYLERFGPDAVLPVFVERLRAEPQAELARIAAFIGLDEAHWQDELGHRHQSRDRLRASAWRDAVVEAPVLRTVRTRLVPAAVRSRVKRRWQMTERPTPGPATRAEIESIYAADLAELGAWLDLDLGLDHFADAVRTGPAAWGAAVPRPA